jgi:perosamine synthetase
VFVDVDRTTWNLDLAIVEQKLNPQVKGIVPVHLYGYPTDMCALQAVASKYELWLVEDACEAHGAECRGVAVGGMGHVGCFSFYGNKTVTTGEGGMLVTDSDELAGKARALRNQASSDGGYWHPRVGFSYRLTSVQAAIGLAQVERLEEFIEARRRIARMYGQLLSSVRGISLHAEDPWSRSVCWLYTILIEDEFGMTRDELMVYLSGQGIECRPVFVPLPSLPAYADGETYPVAERLARCGLSLPTYVGLKPEQTEYIVERIRRAQREATARRQG